MMADWYLSSVKYALVAQWAASTVYAPGAIIRQLATPSVFNGRCFRTTAGGTSGSSEPSWVLTKGAAQPTDGTITDWVEVTGNSAYGWSAPLADMVTAASRTAAGDRILVDSNHVTNSVAAFGTNYNYAFGGTDANPVQILSIDATIASPVTLKSGADLSPYAYYNNSVNITGETYFYGVSITSPGSFNIYSSAYVFENCSLNGSSAGGGIAFGYYNTGTSVKLINCSLTWVNGNHTLSNTLLKMLGGSLHYTGSSTSLFSENPSNGSPSEIHLLGVDATAIPSTASLVGASARWYDLDATFDGVKLPSSYNFDLNRQTQAGTSPYRYRFCDSGNTNYAMHNVSYQGDLQTETTIVKASGASDGTTQISWKHSTNANASFAHPVESEDLVVWNDTVGSPVTFNLDFVHDSLTALTDADIWVEAEYFSSATSSLKSYATTESAVPTLTWAASAATWTTTGMTNPNKQKLSITITPQQKGYILFRVRLMKPSYIVYVDPLVG
ncbi:MAG: hypothetical protein KGL39_11215 [Patescibacteria group bacterium]|nr:hypothetical protein [Patescibacteria group bacterium]